MSHHTGHGRAGTIIVSVVSVVIIAILGLLSMGLHYKSQAVALEEKVAADKSAISETITQRSDALSELVNAAQESGTFSKDAIAELTQARALAESGDINGSNKLLEDMSASYPDIKNLDAYTSLASAASVESTITDMRNTYNADVDAYNKMNTNKLLSFIGFDGKNYATEPQP